MRIAIIFCHPELVSALLHGNKKEWAPKCCNSDITASSHAIPAPSFVIPAQAGIHLATMVILTYYCPYFNMDLRLRGDDVVECGAIHATPHLFQDDYVRARQ